MRELCFDYFNVVCATSKATDQPAHMRSLIRAFASRLKNFTLRYPFFASISAESGKREWSFVT